MGFLDRIFGEKSASPSGGSGGGDTPTLQKKYTDQRGCTYEIYQGKDPEAAKAFLLTKRVDKGKYYLIVETPDGNWGMDVEGLFLEHLRPWQRTMVGSAEVNGTALVLTQSSFGFEMAARGINDNFICRIRCGKCSHEWLDGIRYEDVTAVRCPKCSVINRVDSSNMKAVFVKRT